MSEENRLLHLNEDPKADLHVPVTCPKCGHKFRYTGLGEYECEECHFIDYDDYGRVRNYLDHHQGASIVEVEEATGVKKTAIRRLLEEERLELKPYSTAEGGDMFRQ